MSYKSSIRREAKQPSLWAFAVIYVLHHYFAGIEGLATYSHVADVLGADVTVLWMSASAGPKLLAGGLLLGWWRVTGIRRASGDTSRSDVLGTYAGVTTLVGLFVVSFVLVTVLSNVADYGVPSVELLVKQLLLLVGHAATAVATGAAIGVLTSRSVPGRIAGALSISSVLFLQVPLTYVYILLRGESFSAFDPPADPILFFVRRLTPYRAFNVVTNWIYDVGNSDDSALITARQLHPPPEVDRQLTNAFVVDHTFEGPVPWYLGEWMGLVILAGWPVVSLGMVYWRTSSAGE